MRLLKKYTNITVSYISSLFIFGKSLSYKGAKAYLSAIIDLYDRKVVAYKISKHNDNKLIMDTLNEAISKRKDVHGLILH